MDISAKTKIDKTVMSKVFFFLLKLNFQQSKCIAFAMISIVYLYKTTLTTFCTVFLRLVLVVSPKGM